MLSNACFNLCGVTITQNASAAQRSTIDTSRTLLVWIFFLSVKINGEHFETFKPVQMVGFIMLAIGTLIFNEIVVIPWWGFNKHTNEALERQFQEAKTKEEADKTKTIIANHILS